MDDHPLFRRGVRQALAEQNCWQVCGEAKDAKEALKKLTELRPDLVITDISLPGINGIELVERIKAQDSKIRVLILSVHDEVLFAERALHVGASGYVNKQEPTEKLIGAMRAVVRGRIYLSKQMSQRLLARRVRRAKTGGSATEDLSNRELEIFDLIGRGFPTRQIAERLHLNVRTVETHKGNIKAKLGLANSSELVRRAVIWVMEDS